jgi:hypothetical protein
LPASTAGDIAGSACVCDATVVGQGFEHRVDAELIAGGRRDAAVGFDQVIACGCPNSAVEAVTGAAIGFVVGQYRVGHLNASAAGIAGVDAAGDGGCAGLGGRQIVSNRAVVDQQRMGALKIDEQTTGPSLVAA